MEWSRDLISEGVNRGRRSVLVGFAVATALAITIASFVIFRFIILLFSLCLVNTICILIEEGTLCAYLIVFVVVVSFYW